MPDLESFIARWSAGEGGQERANYALFLSEVCDVLDVPRPDQASHEASLNAYAFERAVTFRDPDALPRAVASTFISAAHSFSKPSRAGGRGRRKPNKAACSTPSPKKAPRVAAAPLREPGTYSC
jgi:hypothetical protein